MIDIRAAARALGGDVIGRDAVAAPGPGHSARDRSLTVRFAVDAPGGFVCFSHCGDDYRPDGTRQPANSGSPPVLVAFNSDDAEASGIPGAFGPNNWTWRPPKAMSRQADLFDDSTP